MHWHRMHCQWLLEDAQKKSRVLLMKKTKNAHIMRLRPRFQNFYKICRKMNLMSVGMDDFLEARESIVASVTKEENEKIFEEEGIKVQLLKRKNRSSIKNEV